MMVVWTAELISFDRVLRFPPRPMPLDRGFSGVSFGILYVVLPINMSVCYNPCKFSLSNPNGHEEWKYDNVVGKISPRLVSGNPRY
jgi:hypothetical protein